MPEQQSGKLPTTCWASLTIVLCVILMAGLLKAPAAHAQPITQALEQPAWTLFWSDEFNGPADASVSSAKWSFDIGDGCLAGICGWGNNEKQYYTNALKNAALNGKGQLAITARIASSGLTCYYGPCRYTSAKIKTIGKFEQTYGRFEARIKLPQGQGLWPAFWLLGSNYQSSPWPDCGEIDIMEYRGSNTSLISSAMHGPGYFGNTPIVQAYTLPSGTFSDTFHVFALEWEPDQVRFYVDNTLHYTVTKATVEQHGPWVFDHSFFIILNLAVGGKFDGDPAADTIFPASMLVDYVRVYKRSIIHVPFIYYEMSFDL